MKAATRKPPGGTEERYRQLRRTLVQFFAWNGVADPDDLADETIVRIIQRAEDSEEIRNITAFALATAKHVLSEYKRGLGRGSAGGGTVETGPSAALLEDEKLHRCLEKCRKQLSRAERNLIDAYYVGEKHEKIANRQKLAAKLGISSQALRLRALRVRQKLAACMAGGCGEKSGE